jgi:hypothetical protein
MGYSTTSEVIVALANALSQGSPSTPGVLVDIMTIGNKVSDAATDDQIYQYIRWADENIDGAISGIYQTPLTRVNRGSFPLMLDALVGDSHVILQDTTRFTPGDACLIRDDVNSQELTVAGIPTTNRLDFTVPLTASYVFVDTNIERLRYPEPIPKISARLAAATLYDKNFAAQVEGNESEYGKFLRHLGWQDLNQILSGVIRLAIPAAALVCAI